MTQGLTHAFPFQFQGPACSNSGHDIGDLKTQSAVVGNGDLRKGDMHLEFPLGSDDVVVFYKKYALALSAVRRQCRRFGVIGKKGDGAWTVGSHGHYQRVLCIQDSHP